MLNWIDQRLPLRFLAFFAIVVLWVLSALQLVVGQASFLWVLLLSVLVVVAFAGLACAGLALVASVVIAGRSCGVSHRIRCDV